MRHSLSTRDLCALFVRREWAGRKTGIRKFANVKLMTHKWLLVAAFVHFAHLGASAQTDQESQVPFGLECDVVHVEGEEHDLVFDLDLGPGDWVVSSHSTDSMFGKFSLRFQEPTAIKLIGSMEEAPPSAWEVEHFSQLDIKVIRTDTRLVQRVAIDSGRQGDLHGEVFFVLEPLCMPFRTSVLLRKSTEDGLWRVAEDHH